ncbi:23S rRNA (cytidine1920-2'-O)/16S rRNA (cytidine1409-2'-O)-methyltransferase [Anaerospora hongkongensis]|uniref:23S rRNA (Cytidine1920-2'-O)/16S rRNA (Cytidine1409-2'-O)-methyltransferase n=1 Tax=Anaerospora hongkongensis TaxID=244830 RepID=A0A4R1Q4U1_9FIRM|nr:TlyA family RNA methyltransferase [Anaerospora hongkongensis]TCL35878.1 23S rRNA (cytidine1920-2'-O)/16S rRNA (cytidine1409-2'-O)-methyltransferase [Anaerospora hongkongensis]
MKERLDVLLVSRGLVASRERAKASIMAGLVYVDSQKVDKAGTLVPVTADITVRGDSIGYVSRGGLKLKKALASFSLDLQGKVMADIGASTGGFTDCALQNGAKRVYAIDVGYGQLAWSLRTDDRVINMERTNIRHVTVESLGEVLDFVSIDVAFISLAKVLPVVKSLLAPGGTVVALIKPQFEAGREKVGKKGVVKDPLVHKSVIKKVLDEAQELGLYPVNLTYSPVKGPEGNIEYLVLLTNQGTEETITHTKVDEIVEESHSQLIG